MEVFTYATADPFLYNKLKAFVKELRLKRPTQAEMVLWSFLRNKQLGVKFRRQHIVGVFIADFCCIEAHLILELDGGYHQLPDQQIKDSERSAWLNANGFHVLRFSNEEVIYNTYEVINKIKKYII